jgi:hypothetical protein
VCTMSHAKSATRSSAVLSGHARVCVTTPSGGATQRDAGGGMSGPYMMRSESLGTLGAPSLFILLLNTFGWFTRHSRASVTKSGTSMRQHRD